MIARKEIDAQHTRATTEPGFMPPPIEEPVETDAQRKYREFMEKKAADEALEAAKEAALEALQAQNDD